MSSGWKEQGAAHGCAVAFLPSLKAVSRIGTCWKWSLGHTAVWILPGDSAGEQPWCWSDLARDHASQHGWGIKFLCPGMFPGRVYFTHTAGASCVACTKLQLPFPERIVGLISSRGTQQGSQNTGPPAFSSKCK